LVEEGEHRLRVFAGQEFCQEKEGLGIHVPDKFLKRGPHEKVWVMERVMLRKRQTKAKYQNEREGQFFYRPRAHCNWRGRGRGEGWQMVLS